MQLSNYSKLQLIFLRNPHKNNPKRCETLNGNLNVNDEHEGVHTIPNLSETQYEHLQTQIST